MNITKGVICRTEKPENMPVDASGRRADVIAGAETTIGRMNIGRLYEHFFGSAVAAAEEEISSILGLPVRKYVSPDVLVSLPAERLESAYQVLLDFYSITSERQYRFFSSEVTNEERIEHLGNVCWKGIISYYPIDRVEDDIEVTAKLQDRFKPTYGPVTYIGNSGKKITTKKPVRIAPLYMMLLDKTADEFSSISLGKLQHFGVLSPITKSEKFSSPVHASSVRSVGETEARIRVGYCGRECLAEEMDRSNNPATQRHIVWNILNAQYPTNIDTIVDRELLELGSNRPLQLLNHMMLTAGYRTVYEPEDVIKWPC